MEHQRTKAICILNNPELNIKGVVMMEDRGDKTLIVAKFSGLPTGKHGFHIHQWGDLSNGCLSAGEHFNPFNKNHGGPNTAERHVGDLGNIEADENGNAELIIEDPDIKLTGELSVIGRAFVVHSNEDDLGTANNTESLLTGNSGPRIACGIIALTNKF